MAPTQAVDGVLPIDKPRGPTSHDVVAAARRALRIRRVGHTGTLDPFASGLLLLCVGYATRIAEYFIGMDKRYRAVVRLGIETDTDDDTGAVLVRRDASSLDRGALDGALSSLRGEIEQVPPQYSAKKVEGERAYRIAREGGVARLAPVRVTVHDLSVVRFDPPDVELEIHCSSGTYIRALARDLGRTLGVGAHLTALRRTAIGDHQVDNAVTMEQLASAPDAAVAALIPPLEAVRGMARIDVDDAGLENIRHGRPVRCDASMQAEDGVAIASDGRLVGLGVVTGGWLQPKKVFI